MDGINTDFRVTSEQADPEEEVPPSRRRQRLAPSVLAARSTSPPTRLNNVVRCPWEVGIGRVTFPEISPNCLQAQIRRKLQIRLYFFITFSVAGAGHLPRTLPLVSPSQ